MLFILLVATVWITFRFKDPVIGLVYIWGLIAIFIEHRDLIAYSYFIITAVVIQGLLSLGLFIHQIFVSLKPLNDESAKYFEEC